jgi:serine/threonine-protein kinase
MSGQVAGDSLIGAVVDDHEVVRLLGAGGMGAVYVARHQRLGTRRAVKVIHDDVKSSPSITKRFFREAQVLSELSHPNIVGVVGFGHLANGWPFLILELIEGRDLQEVLLANGPLPLPAGLRLLLQLGRVLEYAHGRGVVHRDLKPANLLLLGGEPSHIKVIDFGLVKLLTSDKITQLTEVAQIMGSPDYMAPEQANAFPDIREPADVYAWAGIGYAVLSGDSVFGARPPLAAVYAQARETPPRLSQRVPVPRILDDLLYACLAKDPTGRPTASQLVAAIEPLLGEIEPARFAMTAAVSPIAPVAAPALTAPLPDSLSGVAATEPASAAPLGGELTDIIFASPALLAKSRIREALSRQMIAVVRELADALAPADPDLESRRRIIADIESQLDSIEIDAALLDAEIAEASIEDRVDLESRRAGLAERTAGLRTLLQAEQRQLAGAVLGRRRAAAGQQARLFAELDDMLARARDLDGGSQ